MPTYEYANEELGIEVTVRMPVDARPDQIVLRRRSVPSRVTVGTGARPPSIGDKLAAGYKALENAGQLRDSPNYLPTHAIKRAIAEPAVT